MADEKVTPASDDAAPLTLAARLDQARSLAHAIDKAGRNEGQKYNYVRAEDVIAEAQRVLAEVAVIVTPEILDVQLIDSGQTRGGTMGRIALVKLEFDVRCADIIGATDEGMVARKIRWSGTGWDAPGDKALYKAITGGTKYFLAHLIGIPFGADPDDDEGAQPKGASKRKPPAKPENAIPKDRVNAIGRRIGAANLTYADIDVALGAAGINGLRAASGKALGERLESLTPDQATKLEEVLAQNGN